MSDISDPRYTLGYPRTSRRELTPRQENRYRMMWEFVNGVSQPTSYPTSAQVGLSNTCNLKCVYCDEQRVGNTFPRVRLSDQARAHLNPLYEHADTLGFFGISEFMIEPDFFPTVAWCSENHITLSITTNGTVCTPKHLDALGDFRGFLCMAFSVDAATAETYRKIRGWDFERLLSNIRRYLERFAEHPQRRFTLMSFVIMRSNLHEMVPFVGLAKSLGCQQVRYWRLTEIDGPGYRIAAHDGSTFDYREEMQSGFKDAYNEAVIETRREAERLGMRLDSPGLFE